MKKTNILVIVVALLIGSGIFGLLSAKSNDDIAYFPLNPGNTWVYKVTLPDGKIYREDLGVLEPDGDTIKIGILENDSPAAQIEFFRSEDGLYKKKELSPFGTLVMEPAQLSLSSNLKVGSSWSYQSIGKAKYTAKVVRAEKITVPAGTFNTILIQTEGISAEGDEYTDKTWYAKNVGYVKCIYTMNGESKTEELMDYKLEKGKG